MDKALSFALILLLVAGAFFAGFLTHMYMAPNSSNVANTEQNKNTTDQPAQQQNIPSKIEGTISGIVGRDLTIKSGDKNYKVTVVTDAEIYLENETTGDLLTKGFIDLKVGQNIALSAKQVGQGIETSSLVIIVK